MSEIGPTAQRREVGSLLRAHRERVGLTAVEVAARVGVSAAKLSRLERGLRGLQIGDVRSLCAVYELSEEETRELIAATRASREPGWWTEFSGLPETAPMFFGLEMAASRVEEFDALVIPGLLQTEAYASATFFDAQFAEKLPDSVLRERVAARMQRSALLLPREEKRFHFIIDEAALRRVVSTPQVMIEQCRALLDAADRPNVTIQVLPFTAGIHPGLWGSFVIQVFEHANQRDVVFVEGLWGELLVEQDAQVASYRQAFASLTQRALDTSRSRAIIGDIMRAWRAVESEPEA